MSGIIFDLARAKKNQVYMDALSDPFGTMERAKNFRPTPLPEFKDAKLSRGDDGKIIVEDTDKGAIIALDRAKGGGYDLTVNGETKHLNERASQFGFELRGGRGQDTIHVGEDVKVDVTVDGGDGKDTLINSASSGVFNDIKIRGGQGADVVHNSGEDVYVNGGAGADTIFNTGDYAKIRGGSEGWLAQAEDTRGQSADVIINKSNHSRISGDTRSMHVVSDGNDNTLEGGEGVDHLESYGKRNNVRQDPDDEVIQQNRARMLRP